MQKGVDNGGTRCHRTTRFDFVTRRMGDLQLNAYAKNGVSNPGVELYRVNAVRLAQAARDNATTEEVWIAGSMSNTAGLKIHDRSL